MQDEQRNERPQVSDPVYDEPTVHLVCVEPRGDLGAEVRTQVPETRRAKREAMDQWLLDWIGGQGAIRQDQLARLVALAPGGVPPTPGAIRYLMHRWEELGWAIEAQDGWKEPRWLCLTPCGDLFSGGRAQYQRVWEKYTIQEHLVALTDVRLDLEAHGFQWDCTRPLSGSHWWPDGVARRGEECIPVNVCVGKGMVHAVPLVRGPVLRDPSWTQMRLYVERSKMPTWWHVAERAVQTGQMSAQERAAMQLCWYPLAQTPDEQVAEAQGLPTIRTEQEESVVGPAHRTRHRRRGHPRSLFSDEAPSFSDEAPF